jgi:tetratricopeptide (TPR) repeat protein
MEAYCRTVRGRIRLARGDEPGALDDAARALDFARKAEDLQMLYPALAFRARALLNVGALTEASDLAEEVRVLWSEKPDLFLASYWVVDLAIVLDALGRGEQVRRAAEAVGTGTRWLDAASAYVEGDLRQAAGLFAEIGSLPDEALARFRLAEKLSASGHFVEADSEATTALSFFRSVDARAHVTQAEGLLASAIRI